MDKKTSPPSKVGLFVVMGLLGVLILLVILVLMRVYAAVPELPDRDHDTEEVGYEEDEDEDSEIAELREALAQAVEYHDVNRGVLVEQSTQSNNWNVTVRYPSYKKGTPPAFSLSYDASAPWGMMRVAHVDATATDAPPEGGAYRTPYISFFTFRASNYFADGNEGMTFDISTAHRDQYLEDVNKPGNIYELNKDIFLGEDDEFVYLYRYKNADVSVAQEVDALLESFIPLNLDNK